MHKDALYKFKQILHEQTAETMRNFISVMFPLNDSQVHKRQSQVHSLLTGFPHFPNTLSPFYFHHSSVWFETKCYKISHWCFCRVIAICAQFLHGI